MAAGGVLLAAVVAGLVYALPHLWAWGTDFACRLKMSQRDPSQTIIAPSNGDTLTGASPGISNPTQPCGPTAPQRQAPTNPKG